MLPPDANFIYVSGLDQEGVVGHDTVQLTIGVVVFCHEQSLMEAEKHHSCT